MIVVVLSGFAFDAQAQRPGMPSQPNPLRDQVLTINRQEMDRLLLLKPIPSLSDKPARQLLLKQIREDFRDLQNLNNRMMSEAWAREALDYGFVADMISQIRKTANRLKVNLNLPKPGEVNNGRRSYPSNHKDFRASLLIFDKTIMRFVTNPVFQNANTIDVIQATRARQDLETVIELAFCLRKVASTFGKAANR
jgi:hypothetical protein